MHLKTDNLRASVRVAYRGARRFELLVEQIIHRQSGRTADCVHLPGREVRLFLEIGLNVRRGGQTASETGSILFR
jgi:hypothetical protein